MSRDNSMQISLTGEKSHKVVLPAGQGSLSIGTKGVSEDIGYKGWFREPYFISRQRLIRSRLDQSCRKGAFIVGQPIYRGCAA